MLQSVLIIGKGVEFAEEFGKLYEKEGFLIIGDSLLGCSVLT